MNIEEYLVDQVYQRGVFKDKARIIVEAAKNDPANKAVQGTWHDSTTDYPEPLMLWLWMSTKEHAVNWIEENLPNAGFKPEFED